MSDHAPAGEARFDIPTAPFGDIIPPRRAGDAAGTGSLLGAVVHTARPRQWIKNLLVFAAPGAAGVVFHPHALGRAAAAFALFCLASSGSYFLNDAVDAEADRLHPVKSARPVASGLLPVPAAIATAAVLMSAALGLSAVVGLKLLVAMAAYVAIPALGYSLWFKHEPVFDMGAVASGFIVRAIAGGVATGVPLSNWFLIVASFGSLFVVAGKRYAEQVGLGDDAAEHRATLGRYSIGYLRYVRSVSSAVAIAGYCLWAFEKASPAGHPGSGAIWFELSIAPFVLAVLRYSLILEEGGGDAPEDVFLHDRLVQLLAAVWALVFALGVYAI
ncbi:MAG TPA: decaprenyl-phosphate phosphoribosyltransferase [Acidimicrobiales bacterium]|nr:decaprenyl-phosphate phosphoribosyltransferase [Acidimicrobiales bacterium]